MTARIMKDNLTELTPREKQILDLRGQGKTIAEIAAELGVAKKTVEQTGSIARRKLRASA